MPTPTLMHASLTVI
ncbi:hypothetical protein E2C01_070549 [Portunus trituberculatus]|uniref:Uncharacterized protein n=1 Tax=Portunus trituberculatus TaxID=210409 RepID=A0A5B7I5Q7_PORTR|nr:hypothetical protein [Portunus trituberculatus]